MQFDPNIPCGSRDIRIFTSNKKAVTHASGQTRRMLKCIRMQSLIKIYRAVQELLAFSRPAKRLLRMPVVRRVLTCIRMQSLIKIYRAVQEL